MIVSPFFLTPCTHVMHKGNLKTTQRILSDFEITSKNFKNYVSAAKGAAANVAPAQSKSAIHFREVFYSTTETFTSSVIASFII